MSKQGPPSYDESQHMNNPTYPNAGQIGFQPPVNPDFEKSPGQPYPGAGQPYPGAGQPYPNAGQPYPGAGQPYPGAGQPYPGAGQPYPGAGQPYPNAGQPYPVQMQPAPVYASGVQLLGGAVPVMLTNNLPLGPRPTTVMCPSCKENVTTKIRTEAGTLAWLSCGTLMILGCWFGCCLLPFCIDACKDVYHTCPRCKTFFGRYSRLN